MLINVMLIKKIIYISFVALPRLHATAVDCAHELINGESRIKEEAGKIFQNYKMGRAEKNAIINKWAVRSIRNSRVLEIALVII